MSDLLSTLRRYGANDEQLILLDDDSPRLLPYATLLSARRERDAGRVDLRAISAVYEWQGSPLIFIVDNVTNESNLRALRRILAMRGDAPYMGVVNGGTLRVFELGLDAKKLDDTKVVPDVGPDVWATIGSLAYQRTIAERDQDNEKQRKARSNYVSNVILKLLSQSIHALSTRGHTVENAISFVGRALFSRFLADRGLLTEATWPGCEPDHLFDTPGNARIICDWLEEKFNGNLLPLSDQAWEMLSPECCAELGSVMRRADGRQLRLGWRQKWDYLDFSHIPVGVLSQAYEHCLERYDPTRQKAEASFYTPAPIADVLTKMAFSSFEDLKGAAYAKVLDPAAGAGIFLIKAFVEIVSARWQVDGKRPDTATLRQILYDQLTGFDINEAALRFAALGLYLAAIELDPSPEPVEKLKFKNLRETTLHLLSWTTPEDASNDSDARYQMSLLGSLGPLASERHDASYDVVIGNPPWSKASQRMSLDLVNSIIAETVTDRLGNKIAPQIPDKALDQAFLWRSLRWAKPDGRIAFAMHARLLFQRNPIAIENRRALFSAIDVKSVINGTDLRGSNVWPKIAAPFCLFFARNRRADPMGGFKYVSPRRESGLNAAGLMRIDAQNADYVSHQQLNNIPDVFKILFRGTHFDLETLQTINGRSFPHMLAVWREQANRSNKVLTGNGFQTLRKSTKTKREEDSPGDDASALLGMPLLDAKRFAPGKITVDDLPKFTLKRVHRLRDPELYSAPILLVVQSPPVASKRILSAFLEEKVVFTESIYGWQLPDDTQGHAWGRYLSLIVGSKISLWICLMRGGKFGVEREALEMTLINELPVPPLSGEDWGQMDKHYQAITSHEPDAWEGVDRWLAQLLGLSDEQLQVIKDTLDFSLTYTDTREEAEAAPSKSAQKKFLEILKTELEPWFEPEGLQIKASFINPSGKRHSAWIGFSLSASKDQEPMGDMEGLHRAADSLGLTQVILDRNDGCLNVARLNQARYWSRTQARILAADIIMSHLDTLRKEAA
ncbi:hypothetical protein RP75_21160 [Agrobacterium arsenijevicii]|uniref:site-specific DNA-methyltransferase (adenine-specific) n=2 Tax=Agrobacterium arsenijevicii TaxID=1585697 RepID=A0ABR5D304_9HYPH|nr:hypothetical protein RP75_21160 [Agrobacterium arsenijevicii]